MSVSVMATTMDLARAVPNLSASTPSSTAATSSLTNAAPVPAQDVHVDDTVTNTGRTITATMAFGQTKQRANH